MARGGFSREARVKRWRRMYGEDRAGWDGKPGRWTYRAIAQRYRVSPMTVYLALNPERRTRVPRGAALARRSRPVTAGVPLTREEHAALKARAQAERLSVAALVRRLIFEGSPPLVEVPPEREPGVG